MNIKYKILCIDDELAIRKILKHLLEAQGYEVIDATNGKEGLAKTSQFIPDVILLDLDLGDMKGEEVLRSLRSWSKIPVIVLTANKADDEKVLLLDSGADDYLIKPFHGPELLARIRVAIRHSTKELNTPELVFGDLKIDIPGHVATIKNGPVKLTAKEFSFLKILASNAGKIITQAQLLNEIWGPNNEHNSHYLRIYAAQLRKKIETPLGRKIILTESGIGYRFLSDPEK